MYKSIVVGTDGSETAGEAVRQAVELAKAFGSTLHVVCGFRPALTSRGIAALNPEAAAMGGMELLAEAESATADEVDAMLQQLANKVQADGVSVRTHGVGGDGAEALIEVAENEKADLIVVGNRGMAGAKRFLLGSVPNKISHHAPCSVLIVSTSS